MKNTRGVWIGVAFLLLVFYTCNSTSSVPNDGRVYVVNNTRPPETPGGNDYVKWVKVVYEGTEYDIPHNMDHDGNPTGVGAIELTRGEPLPGGLAVQLVYKWDHQGGNVDEGRITVTVDGNMTIEMYMLDPWESFDPGGAGTLTARVVRGKWDGIHRY